MGNCFCFTGNSNNHNRTNNNDNTQNVLIPLDVSYDSFLEYWKTNSIVCMNDTNPKPKEQKEQKDPKVPKFSLQGHLYCAVVVDVYDGDTITVQMVTCIGLHQWKIRMIGYDSPEKRPRKNIPNYQVHKNHGHTCQKVLERLIGGKKVFIECGEWDKYGRLLGTVWIKHQTDKDGIPITYDVNPLDLSFYATDRSGLDRNLLNVNQWMICSTPSCVYDGKTKETFSFQGEYSEFYWKMYQITISGDS